MKYSIIILFNILISSCAPREYSLFKDEIKAQQNPLLDVDPTIKDLYISRFNDFAYFKTNKIRLEKKDVEFTIFIKNKFEISPTGRFNDAFLSIIPYGQKYAPSFFAFHNTTELRKTHILAMSNHYYRIDFDINKLLLKVSKIKKFKGIVPDMIYEKAIPMNIKVNNFITKENFTFREFLDTYQQDTILVNFWDSSCSQCFEQIPTLQKIYAKGKYGYFNISSQSYNATKYIYENNPFPGVTIESKKEICKYFNQSGFPSEYLIDKKTGKVLKVFMGIQGLEPELY